MTNPLNDKFAEIVSEAITAGTQRGVDVFTESLEEDLAKSEVLDEVTTEAVIDHLMTEAGYEVVEED